MKKMALPWPESAFNGKVFAGTQAYIEESGVSNPSTFEQMARVITLWSRVSSMVRLSSPVNFHEQLSAIYALDQDLKTWWNRLPDCCKLTSTGSLPADDNVVPNVLLINIFYHQSFCVLHSSLVPVFSWSKQKDAWPNALQLSAQTAYEHACEVSLLIGKVLDGYSRLGAMPSFVSYAAYCGCMCSRAADTSSSLVANDSIGAIQIPFMSSTDALVREKAQRNVATNVKMIETMSTYWKIASILRFYVQYLLKVHEQNPSAMAGEPKNSTIETLISFRRNGVKTRTSILEFMGIIRPDGDGYVKPGDECDLQADDGNSITEPPSRQSERVTDLEMGDGSSAQQESSMASIGPPPQPQPTSDSGFQLDRPTGQYRPGLLSYLGTAGPEQLDLGMENQDYFNPFFDLQPLNVIYDNTSPGAADFNGCPFSLGYIYPSENAGSGCG